MRPDEGCGCSTRPPGRETGSVLIVGPGSQVGGAKSSQAPVLDTIGYNCTKHPDRTESEVRIIKRAKRKAITQAAILPLIRYVRNEMDYAESEQEYQRLQKFENRYCRTYNCSHMLIQNGNTFSTWHCRERWCAICNGIQAGKNQAAYGEQLEAMNEPYLVTLTNRNCVPDELGNTLDRFQKAWRYICKQVRAKYHLQAFRKLEVTYSIRLGTFNPHYHIIVDGKEQAQLMLDTWLSHWKGDAEIWGQNMRQVSDKKGAIREVFKYTHKLYDKGQPIPPDVLFLLHQSLHGRQLFGAVGMRKNKDDNYEGEVVRIDWKPPKTSVFIWRPLFVNWKDFENEFFIRHFELTKKEKRLIKSAHGHINSS